MAYTSDDLSAVRKAIASGARRVRIQGEETEFRTLAELKQIEATIRAEVEPLNAPVRRSVAVLVR